MERGPEHQDRQGRPAEEADLHQGADGGRRHLPAPGHEDQELATLGAQRETSDESRLLAISP